MLDAGIDVIENKKPRQNNNARSARFALPAHNVEPPIVLCYQRYL